MFPPRTLALVCVYALLAAVPISAQLPDATSESVTAACLETYFEGMTPDIAAATMGRGAIDYLLRLLADDSFSRPDNVVAFLAYLNDPAAVKPLYDFAIRTERATSPEQYRAVLLVNHALGRLAAARIDGAHETLQRMASLTDRDHAFAPALVREALYGLAYAGDYDTIFGAIKAVTTVPVDTPLSETQTETLSAFSEMMKNPIPDVFFERYPRLATLGALSVSAASRLDLSYSPNTVDVETIIDLITGSDAISRRASRASLARRGTGTTHKISFCNHKSVTSPMTTTAAKALLSQATSLLKTANFAGDVKCDATMILKGSGGTFGAKGDGLNSINTNSALQSVLGNSCARVHVVDAINFCGGAPASNVIGCGKVGGTGIAVVRLSSSLSEGALWAHEYGHNLGLSHSGSSKNIMFPTLNTAGGVTQAQCDDAYNPTGSSCFASSATVEVQGRGRVRIDSLQEGDLVADGSEEGFSRFVTYLHYDSNSTADFVAIAVAGLPRRLLLTSEHFVFTFDQTGAQIASRADRLLVGDVLDLGSGRRAPITAIAREQQHGFVGPLTESGKLVVDGVLASCYSDQMNTPAELAHTVMKPLVWLSRIFPTLARHDTTHSDIHWYAQTLVRLAKMGEGVHAHLDEFRGMLQSAPARDEH